MDEHQEHQQEPARRFQERPMPRVPESGRVIAVVIVLPPTSSASHHSEKITQWLRSKGYSFTVDIVQVKDVEDAALR